MVFGDYEPSHGRNCIRRSPQVVVQPSRKNASLSLREGVLVLGRRSHYLRHLCEAARPVCERQRRSGQTGRSVSERECRSWVAGPIIYGTCARRVAQFARGRADPAGRVAQFARGSAAPGSPAPLFTASPRGGSLSLREAAPVRRAGSLSLREGALVLGRRPHYLRHFRKAGRSVCERQCGPSSSAPLFTALPGTSAGGGSEAQSRR